MRLVKYVLFLCLCAGLAVFAAEDSGNKVTMGAIDLEPCDVGGVETLCGSYDVYEDREKAEGRKISLKIVVAKANAENPHPDPIFFFSGGPGVGNATTAGGTIRMWSQGSRTRDLVFIDQRGTGASNPLNCDVLGDPDSVQSYLGDMFTKEYVTACREKLEKTAKLGMYGTTTAIDDTDEIRAALGYEKINISGGSYGGRLVLEYIRRYPQNIRAALPMAPATPAQIVPQSFARDAQAAMTTLVEDCRADETCNGAFPNFEANLNKVLAQLKKGPVTQEVSNPWTEKKETVSLGHGPFIAGIRALLYDPMRAAVIPKMVEEAASGNFEPITLFTARYQRGLSEFISDGQYLDVTCAEDLPVLDMKIAKKDAKTSFLGNYRVERQSNACKLWARGKMAPDFHQPIKSDVPTLFVTGEDDPVTPPYWSVKAAKYMTNSKVVIIPNTSHGMSNAYMCSQAMVNQFLKNASVADVDEKCIQSIERPKWITEQAQFERFFK